MWIVLFLSYVALFMSLAYPQIPEQFGGGRPRKVRLLVVEENQKGLRELGISFSGTGQLSDPVDLLYEGEDQYIFRTTKGNLIRVNKDLVMGSTG